MKERKKLLKKSSSQEKIIKIEVYATIILAFVIGFLISWIFGVKPLNESQYEECEKVAQDVYMQKEKNIKVEEPEGYSIDIDATTITVELDKENCRGKVIAELQNGELVFTRDKETSIAVWTSIIAGVLAIVLCSALFESGILDFVDRFTKNKKWF